MFVKYTHTKSKPLYCYQYGVHQLNLTCCNPGYPVSRDPMDVHVCLLPHLLYGPIGWKRLAKPKRKLVVVTFHKYAVVSIQLVHKLHANNCHSQTLDLRVSCNSFMSAVVIGNWCCPTAPSHYLNQCWFIIDEVLLHSSKTNFACRSQYMNSWNDFWKMHLRNYSHISQGPMS